MLLVGTIAPQGVAPGPAAVAAPQTWLEVQSPHHRLSKSGSRLEQDRTLRIKALSYLSVNRP